MTNIDFTPASFDPNAAGWVGMSGAPAPGVDGPDMTEQMAGCLDMLGIEYFMTEGVYKGVAEPSLIAKMPVNMARQLAELFDQESIVTYRGLIACDTGKPMARAISHVTGDAARTQDCYTVLPNGDAFSLILHWEE